MGCRTLIGATAPGGAYLTRWLHWGDRPDLLVPILRQIWRHTFRSDTTALLEALLAEDWSYLDPQAADGRGSGPVAGVGYPSPGGTGTLRRGLITGEVTADLEWLYLIDVAGHSIHVYEATCHDRWLQHSHHDLDPQPGPVVLGCGGHTAHGHEWRPAQVVLDNQPPVLDAEVCTGRHGPYDYTIARFTGEVADIIADTNLGVDFFGEPTFLRRAGTEFDLICVNGRGVPEPLRVARDHDGRLLIGAHLWPWHRADHLENPDL